MNRWIQIAFIAAGIGLLVAVALHATSEQSHGIPVTQAPAGPHAKASAPTHPLDPKPVSKPAPQFALPDKSGKIVKLSDFRGKWVLLNFWATWCAPCREELPHLAALAQQVADLPIEFVLVSLDKNFEDIDGLAEEIAKSASSHRASELWTKAGDMLRGKLPKAVSLLDTDGATPPRYGTSKYPETYLIDPQGQVTTWFVGPKAWGHPKSVEFIRNATGQQKPGK